MNKEDDKKEFVNSPTFWFIVGLAVKQAFLEIIKYITIWFFAPVWSRIVDHWNSYYNADKKEEENNDK